MRFESTTVRLAAMGALFFGLAISVSAQGRARVVTTQSSRPVTGQTAPAPTTTRPVLSTPITVQGPRSQQGPLVTKTASVSARSGAVGRSAYSSVISSVMMSGIQARLGIPYRRGTVGPDRYDCSGFVWSIFKDAGISFTRSSAKVYWEQFEPVEGDERFKFGTLVFFNKLGHVGIVADEKGFYHASSSKGITYSPFAGYWEKRIVGYRRIPFNLGKTQEKSSDPSVGQ